MSTPVEMMASRDTLAVDDTSSDQRSTFETRQQVVDAMLRAPPPSKVSLGARIDEYGRLRNVSTTTPSQPTLASLPPASCTTTTMPSTTLPTRGATTLPPPPPPPLPAGFLVRCRDVSQSNITATAAVSAVSDDANTAFTTTTTDLDVRMFLHDSPRTTKFGERVQTLRTYARAVHREFVGDEQLPLAEVCAAFGAALDAAFVKFYTDIEAAHAAVPGADVVELTLPVPDLSTRPVLLTWLATNKTLVNERLTAEAGCLVDTRPQWSLMSGRYYAVEFRLRMRLA